MINSNLVNEAKSIDEIVRGINDTSCANPHNEVQSVEHIAAAYAQEAADEAGYGLSEENLDAHLLILSEAGADFNNLEALKLALNN